MISPSRRQACKRTPTLGRLGTIRSEDLSPSLKNEIFSGGIRDIPAFRERIQQLRNELPLSTSGPTGGSYGQPSTNLSAPIDGRGEGEPALPNTQGVAAVAGGVQGPATALTRAGGETLSGP